MKTNSFVPRKTGSSLRPGLAIVTGVLAAALAVSGATNAASAADGPSIVGNAAAARSHLWGVDAYSADGSTVAKLQAKMQRGFTSYAVYSQLDEGAAYPTWDARTAMEQNALIYLNINSTHGPTSNRSPICYRDIISGARDALIDQWSRAITHTGYHKMVITFQHEQSIDNDMQPKCRGESPAMYGQAFHHVATRMRAHGVTEPFAWVPTASAFEWGYADQYAPPAGDFSVVGVDVYAGPANNWRSASEELNPFFAWQARHAPGKALLVGEIGATQTDPRAPGWYSDAMTLLKRHDNLVAVNWNATNTKGSRYSPLLNPKTLTAWTAAANNHFFG